MPFEDPATGVKRAGAQLGQSSDHDFVREHKPEACLKIQGWAHVELQAQRAGFMPARGYISPSCSCFLRLQTFKAISVHPAHACMSSALCRMISTFGTHKQMKPPGILKCGDPGVACLARIHSDYSIGCECLWMLPASLNPFSCQDSLQPIWCKAVSPKQ